MARSSGVEAVDAIKHGQEKETMASVDGALRLDVARPKGWRRFVPVWLRSLIWVDSAQKYDAFLSYSWKTDFQVAPVRSYSGRRLTLHPITINQCKLGQEKTSEILGRSAQCADVDCGILPERSHRRE